MSITKETVLDLTKKFGKNDNDTGATETQIAVITERIRNITSHLKDNKVISSLYEPVHGSAPDIAGKNIANPLATIMSFFMMINYSFNNEKLSKVLEQSIINVLNKGYRTQDIYKKGLTKVSTDQMGDLIIKELETII